MLALIALIRSEGWPQSLVDRTGPAAKVVQAARLYLNYVCQMKIGAIFETQAHGQVGLVV